MTDIFRTSFSVFKQVISSSTIVYFTTAPERNLDGYILGTGDKELVYTTKVTSEPDINDFVNNHLNDAIELPTEADVIAFPTIDRFTTVRRFDLTGKDFIFIGIAPSGTADNEQNWTIQRFELDPAGNMVKRQTTAKNAAIWDNRDTETYL